MRITALEADRLEGEWVRWEGEPSKPKDGDVYVLRIDEPFTFATERGDMDYDAGDYIVIVGAPDPDHHQLGVNGVWPAPAAELEQSDGREACALRYSRL